MNHSTLDKKELARLRKLEIKINLFAFCLGFAVSFVWNRITGDVFFAMFIFSFVTIVTTHWLFRKKKLHLVAKAFEESEKEAVYLIMNTVREALKSSSGVSAIN